MDININLQMLNPEELQVLQEEITQAIQQYQARIEDIQVEETRRSQARVFSIVQLLSDFSVEELGLLQAQIKVKIGSLDSLRAWFDWAPNEHDSPPGK